MTAQSSLSARAGTDGNDSVGQDRLSALADTEGNGKVGQG